MCPYVRAQNGGSSVKLPGLSDVHGSVSPPWLPWLPWLPWPPWGRPWPPPAPFRLARLTLAEAFRSEGPTSSTSTSYTVRFSPSLVSYDRCRSRPDTMTRIPRVSDSATFSAACRHTLHVRKRLSPSFHSPVVLSRNRGVDATRNFATGCPDGVNRSSGSSTRFPAIVIWVSPAAISLLSVPGAL